jgi:hypothetical protein
MSKRPPPPPPPHPPPGGGVVGGKWGGGGLFVLFLMWWPFHYRNDTSWNNELYRKQQFSYTISFLRRKKILFRLSSQRLNIFLQIMYENNFYPPWLWSLCIYYMLLHWNENFFLVFSQKLRFTFVSELLKKHLWENAEKVEFSHKKCAKSSISYAKKTFMRLISLFFCFGYLTLLYLVDEPFGQVSE